MNKPHELEQLGFALEQTGGGCTALVLYAIGGEILITAQNDTVAPEALSDPVLVTWHDNGGIQTKAANYQTLRDAYASLAEEA